MSKENIQKFYEMLMQTPDAADALNKAAEGVESAEKAACILIEFAKNRGFDFSIEDLAAFEQDNQRELAPEELEKINAAGAGGFCILFGWGWNEGYGAGYTKCSVIGGGLGITWNDCNEPDNEFAGQVAKKVVTAITAVGGAAIQQKTGLK